MSEWNPSLYTRFEAERTRPAAELLARVPLAQARNVVDLGCGPGNSTALLVARFPHAQVIGVDNSSTMLASARERLPSLQFEQADIGDWAPAVPADVLYANAALQWVPKHEALFPRLMSLLAPGGVLAVQMPDNLDEPSHTLMRDVAADPRFAPEIGEAHRLRDRVLNSDRYYDMLATSADVDLFRTTYYHRMADAAAIVQWLRATGLKPFLDALAPASQVGFLAEYERRIDAAYPKRSDGERLLAFPRLFIVARKRV